MNDEPMVLEVCQRILQLAGFHTILVHHGKDGSNLESYEAHHLEVALTVTDGARPIMDGI
jgi:hypothetical protein